MKSHLNSLNSQLNINQGYWRAKLPQFQFHNTISSGGPGISSMTTFTSAFSFPGLIGRSHY